MNATTHTKEQIIAALIVYVSNQKTNDKHSIAYMCGMTGTQRGYNTSVFVSTMSRAEVMQCFIDLLNEGDNYLHLMKSDRIKKDVETILNKPAKKTKAKKTAQEGNAATVLTVVGINTFIAIKAQIQLQTNDSSFYKRLTQRLKSYTKDEAKAYAYQVRHQLHHHVKEYAQYQ